MAVDYLMPSLPRYNMSIEGVFICDTAIYASGDVLSNAIELPNAVKQPGGIALLHSICVYDTDDQGAGMDLVILKSNVSLGTLNAAVSISDADAKEILAIIAGAGASFVDLGGVRVLTTAVAGNEFILQAAAGSTSLWIAAISRGTGTYTVSGLTFRVGLVRE